MAMSVSAVPSPANVATDRAILVMKKTRNVEKQAAESLIELLKQVPSAARGRIDTYA